MAAHYEVSLTPVRVAVRALIDAGYLRKENNARLAVQPRPTGAHRGTRNVKKPAPPPDWAEIMTHDIMFSSLRGDTGFLREEATAGRYGVSRTVVRQVFSRLAGKGLLEHVPRSGWRVRRFDEDDMSAYLEVREILELKALALAQTKLARADLESMLAGNPVPEAGKAVQLDNRIHAYLLDKAGNFYLHDFFERHGAYYMLLFERAALEAQVVAEMAGQHRAILHALIEEDWAGAGQALVQHIRAQRPIMRKLLLATADASSARVAVGSASG
jgi:DNA-binding GntR family transcriptional regulator